MAVQRKEVDQFVEDQAELHSGPSATRQAKADAPKTTTSDGDVLTGHDMAFVNVKREPPNNVVQVFEGDPLPTDLADGERDRLDALGAFGEHGRVAHAATIQQQLAAQAAAGVPTAFPAAPGDDDTDPDAGEDDDGEASGNAGVVGV